MKITTKTKPEKIFKIFRDASDRDEINLTMPWGHIYLAGGILSKLQEGVQYFAIKSEWVKDEFD